MDGDIVNVDVSTIYNGYYSDASRMFMIGNVAEEDKKLVTVAKECLDKGFAAVKPWGFLGDVGAAIQEHAKRGEGMVLVPGMVFTIEPMLNQGDYEVFVDEDDDWTVFTEDGGYSAQWEYTVLVTEDGAEIIAW